MRGTHTIGTNRQNVAFACTTTLPTHPPAGPQGIEHCVDDEEMCEAEW